LTVFRKWIKENGMENIIEIRNVSLQIKNVEILKNVDISFEQGKIHGLIGRNGSGKTMLMKCICGFVNITKGSITVENKVIGKDVDFPENIGFIIETPGFIPYYSGYKNLMLLAGLRNKIGKEEVKKVMTAVGLDYGLKRMVKKYSLGMRQRLGIAQAIMEKPSILILDEPFNGLDKEGVEEMRKYFLGLKEEGTTILMCSHSSDDINILCDTVAEMDRGILIKIKES
jgi:ABC-2 type transport system ATP-binding protein